MKPSLHLIIYFVLSIFITGCTSKQKKNHQSNQKRFNTVTKSPILLNPPKLNNVSFDRSLQPKEFKLKYLFKKDKRRAHKRIKSLVNACDYRNSIVKNKSNSIAGKSEGYYNIGQVCDIYEYYTSNWKYVNDPKNHEYYASASTSILNGLHGDCDDFAIVVCSSILSIGGIARINFALNNTSGHAFTEVKIPRNKVSSVKEYIKLRYNINKKIEGKYDKNGDFWLNMDWGTPYPGKKYFSYNEGFTFYIVQRHWKKLKK